MPALDPKVTFGTHQILLILDRALASKHECFNDYEPELSLTGGPFRRPPLLGCERHSFAVARVDDSHLELG